MTFLVVLQTGCTDKSIDNEGFVVRFEKNEILIRVKIDKTRFGNLVKLENSATIKVGGYWRCVCSLDEIISDEILCVKFL